MTKVAVLIVGFRNAADVTRCLSALAGSTFQDFEAVVCENGGASAFQTLSEAAASLPPGGPPVRLIDAGANLGFAGGVNRCIAAAADADALWLLNPDTEPEPDALAALVERLVVGDCDAVGGVLVDAAGTVQTVGGRWLPWLARAESLGRGKAVGTIDPAEVERDQSFISGASLMVSRRFVEVAGPMREDYFLYGEELEWCLRAQAQGLKLGFAPGAVVRHHQGATTGSAVSVAKRPKLPVYLDERNKLLLTRDINPGRLPVVAITSLALLCLRYGLKGRGGSLNHALAGWWAGLRNRRGRPAFAAA